MFTILFISSSSPMLWLVNFTDGQTLTNKVSDSPTFDTENSFNLHTFINNTSLQGNESSTSLQKSIDSTFFRATKTAPVYQIELTVPFCRTPITTSVYHIALTVPFCRTSTTAPVYQIAFTVPFCRISITTLQLLLISIITSHLSMMTETQSFLKKMNTPIQ